MRSVTSFFDWTIYKKTVARFWPLWAGYFVLWTILLPLYGLSALREDAAAQSEGVISRMESFSYLNVPEMSRSALYIALVFGALSAMAVFSHLYSARPANLFGSLPIRREGLFLTHYLAGLSWMIVPNAAVFLLTLLVEAAGGCVSMQGLLFWLGVSCGECFLFYSMAVFCAMFTGHILALPAFYGILNLLAYGLMQMLYTVFQTFYYGFAGFGGTVSTAVKWLTPVQCLAQQVGCWWAATTEISSTGEVTVSAERVLTTDGLGTVGIYALAAAALTACAFLLYRARRLESAGDVVSVKPMRPVFKYGMALCVGLVFGYGTAWTLGGGEPLLMAAILIWGVAGCFAAQMLLDKSFRVFKKWRGAAAVAGVFIALFLAVGFDVTGFETRVPDAAGVKSVFFDGLYSSYLDDDGHSVWLEIDDPEQIALLVDLHQAVVDGRDGQGNRGAYYGTTRVKLTYTLKNGSTMTRKYDMELDPGEVDQEGSAAWAVEKLYRDTGLYWRVYGFDKLEEETAGGGRLDRAEFWHDDDEQGQLTTVVGYGRDARTLLDAVEEDFLAGRIGVRTVADVADYYAHGRDGRADTLVFWVNDPETGRVRHRLQIAVQSTSASTLAELERLAEDLDGSADRALLEAELRKMKG